MQKAAKQERDLDRQLDQKAEGKAEQKMDEASQQEEDIYIENTRKVE